VRKLGAEFIGTFALVFSGTGAIVIDETTGGAVMHVGVALTFGLIVLAMIYTVGDISGAHLNPAVSLGFFASRRFPLREAIPYIASQCGGALAASGLLALCLRWSAAAVCARKVVARLCRRRERLEGVRKIRDEIQARIEAWCDQMCAVEV
jgi:glycerol uptake facilitator-like aquaporin